jgi:hypothetical protein
MMENSVDSKDNVEDINSNELLEELRKKVALLTEDKIGLERTNMKLSKEYDSLKFKASQNEFTLGERVSHITKIQSENEELRLKVSQLDESLHKMTKQSYQFENMYNSVKTQLNRQELELVHRYEVERQLEQHIVQLENDFQNKFTLLSNQSNLMSNNVIRHQNEIISKIENEVEILELKYETMNVLVSRLNDKLQKKVKCKAKDPL